MTSPHKMETLSTRTRTRNDKAAGDGPVLYWMQRDQRVQDNWALVKAQKLALESKVPLLVLFNIPKHHGNTTLRHYEFMISGLDEVQAELHSLGISFWVTEGNPGTSVSKFVKDHNIGAVVSDFNPLQFTDIWREEVAEKIPVSFVEVDAHNIVPCWVASNKEEFAAHTFRPKMHRLLKEYLVSIPKIKKHNYGYKKVPTAVDWEGIKKQVDSSVEPVQWLTPGAKAGKKRAKKFITSQLDSYAANRNDPNKLGVSHMSPYLRYGQVSAQWLALEVHRAKADKESREAYLEELIVRRELTDNFCFYNKNYNKVEGAHAWAQKTIAEHKKDAREYVYSFKQFETAETHDELWNAMQTQMVLEGKMHGWCRMYWAKKILEWTPDVQTAIDTALLLNDKYELDGRDPNGYVGVMWSICGVHDRAWGERPVFGKIRYMNFNGAKRKFDINAYIEKYSATTESLFDE